MWLTTWQLRRTKSNVASIMYLQFESMVIVFSLNPNGFSSTKSMIRKLTQDKALNEKLDIRSVDVAPELEHVAHISSDRFELLNDVFHHELVLTLLVLSQHSLIQMLNLCLAHLINWVLPISVRWTLDYRHWGRFLTVVNLSRAKDLVDRLGDLSSFLVLVNFM